MTRVHLVTPTVPSSPKPDHYQLYLETDTEKFWVQSASTAEALMQPRSTIRRWFAQMSVSAEAQTNKTARLVINKNGFPMYRASYTGMRIHWKYQV